MKGSDFGGALNQTAAFERRNDPFYSNMPSDPNAAMRYCTTHRYRDLP
ncbi:hypothetical protein Sarmat_00131 [Rickettsiales endosymbiont of Paramecium tredecaurelia]|nr:hypothetical protein [Candidatus Sarmatiella mevalonica]MBL3284291.1 hypothetical protein [Candidatus Sarmatiella mevalonica]